jgi:hypothetical protein
MKSNDIQKQVESLITTVNGKRPEMPAVSSIQGTSAGTNGKKWTPPKKG